MKAARFGRRLSWHVTSALLALATCLGHAALSADDPTEFRLRRAWSLFGSSPGAGGLLASDFDLDGRVDLIASSALPYNSKRHDWYQVRLQDSEFEVTWSSLFHAEGTGLLASGIAYGRPAVVTTTWYEIQVFSGPSKALLHAMPSPVSEIAALHLADLDLDGQEELVLCDQYDLFVYDLRTGLEEDVRLGFGCSGLDSGQLDEDPPLELLLAGNPLGGFMLDGASLALEWADTSGFGQRVRAIDIDSDGLEEIVAGSFGGGTMRALDPRTSVTLWESPGLDATSFEVAEVDTDSMPELIVVDENTTILALNAESGGELFSFEPPGGAQRIASGDFDGNGTQEIVWSSGYNGIFYACDAGSLDLIAESRPWVELMPDVGIGDVEADGTVELVVASSETFSPPVRERVALLSTPTLSPPRYAPPIDYRDLAALGVAQLDPDSALEMCVVEYSSSNLSCFDGDDFSRDLSLPLGDVGQVHFLASGPIDSGPEDELIVSVSNTRLLAIDTPSGAILWEAAVPPGVFGEFYGLRIANLDANDAARDSGRARARSRRPRRQ